MSVTDAALVARASVYLLNIPASELRFRALPDSVGRSQKPVRGLEVGPIAGRFDRLLIKPCSLRERIALALVDGSDAVPRVFVDDITTDQVMDVVMIDAGDTLLGSDARGRGLAAGALSEMHARFLGHDGQLSALPPLTEEYLSHRIMSWSWRVSWMTSIEERRFLEAFGSWQKPVEKSAASLAVDLTAFAERLQLDTLVHTNIQPARLLEQDGRAVIINWGQARRAPLFVDLGITFDTVEAGWVYRDALADRGVFIGDDVFLRGHQLARRFAGIRHLRFWLNAWLAHPKEANRAGLQRMLTMAAGSTTDKPGESQ